MRTPQPCSNISHGKLQGHSTEEERSVVSQEIGQSVGSSSSFSVQECINEFRSRKIHHSSQSNQNEDDDLIFQNNSNKKNERISKPCKDGFCYCFTSDSDDFRSRKIEEKRKGRKSDSAGQQVSDVSNSNSNVTRRETYPLNTKKRLTHTYPKNGLTRKVTAISRLEDSSQNSKAPLIHIIQEIRNNCVVSEVRVNKQKIRQKSSPTKKQAVPEKKVINSVTDLPNYPGGVSEIESLGEKFQNSSLNTSSRSSDKNGGRLLQKRLSGTSAEFKPRNLSTPPRKPPRNVIATNSEQTSISTAPSIREAEKILDDFLLRKGIPIPQKQRTSKDKSNRKSYPLTEGITAKNRSKFSYEKPLPSCPSLSDIEHLGSEKYAESCGLLQEQAVNLNHRKIRDMLNLDVKSKNFESNNSQCGPQVGWRVPHKLDIDTVDGTDHNLVANITSKCTPVKTEMLNNKTESQKFILAEQLKNIVSTSPWTGKKTKNKENIRKSNSFLSASKTKLLRFVTKKSPPKNRSIGVQTRTEDEHRTSFNHQSPPGSYFSNTPAKNSKSSQTEFDFSRTINSPKREKVSQRKLLFPTRNVKETKMDSKTNQTYHSYNSDLDKDFTLSKMGQVLSNIKCRLEASDDLAVGTFRDIKRKEAVMAAAAAALSYDCVDGYDYQRAYHTSAQADVHNEAEPTYSEIEEDSVHITESPVIENTNAIEHFFVGSDPKAIYAKINKTPKKSKQQSNSFNNVMEQNSPPKLRHVSKTDLSVQSEIFLENLTSENNIYVNRLHDKEEKVPNALQDEILFEGINLDDSYATVNSFRELLDKESDAVSYEYPDESINPINEENCTGNQSTPKKPMHLTKFGTELTSNDDVHQTESCPTTPGWLSTYAQEFNPREDSISLQEESITNAEKPGNSSLWKYRTLKSKLRQSIRKSRHFLKHERKRITSSLNLSKPMNTNHANERWDESSLCLTNLFSMNESAPVKDQLTQAVEICRQYPELETSPEMVEAERLLLFSTLKRDVKNPNLSISPHDIRPKGSMDIKTLRLPIKENIDQEVFFNFYYIGVFSCGRHIKSTQSAECKNGEAIFRNCNLLFNNIEPESEVRCDIFMLRLRKVSTSRKPLSKAKKLSSASTSSEEILSRFRPHASFTLHPRDFVPYFLMENCEKANEESFCLHAVGSCKFSINPQARSTNLLNDVHVYSEVEQLFKKFSKKGFLNVQDMDKRHSWNLRWCELDSFSLKIWSSPNDVLINEPVQTLDIGKCISNSVVLASREVCARSRSFCLEFKSDETHSGYCFSADNQNDLNYWMSALNEVLEFIAAWMK